MDEITLSRGWRDALASLIGRRRDVWVVAAVVAGAAALGFALWGRSSEARIAPPATAPPDAGLAPATATTPSATPAPVVLVHVAGAVRRPGLYELLAGARLGDAIAAAGGARRGAELDALNLAEVVSDGQKVDVPRHAATAPAPSAVPAPLPGATPSSPGLVNLNTADQAALEAIPGIGPVTATAILEYREQVGSFTSPEQLLEVSGIGPATLESMRPYITL